MNLFDVVAILLVLSAGFGTINYRWLHLPRTIGLMLAALVMSVAVLLLDAIGLELRGPAQHLINSIDFSQALFHGILSFLLFAGALHINLEDLLAERAIVGVMATVGVVVSTLLVGFASWLCFDLVGLDVPLVHCLLFGALISPTDPIAVLAILKTVHAPRSIEVKIAGESLFNDGVAVVVFVTLLRFADGSSSIGALDVTLLFLREALGGAALGFAAGWLTYWVLASIDEYQLEILLTLALVAGCTAMAEIVHVSGPIAVVMAGIVIGSRGRSLAMTAYTREHLDTFWELIDEILNAVLFVLIGLEILIIPYDWRLLVATGGAAAISLLARWIAVALPVGVFRRFRPFSAGTIRVLTWGGLRGGISIALALSLPEGPYRENLVAITYGVVIFSILVQGLTIRGVIARSPLE